MMQLHDQAQKLTLAAERLQNEGKEAEATALYRQAAALELEAFDAVAPEKHKTFSITGLSCLSLFYRGAEFDQALQVARRLLSQREKILPYYLAQIEEAFDILYSEHYMSKEAQQFANRGMEIRLLGGEVGLGVAPADLFLAVADAWRSITVRVAEYLANYAYRTRGGAPADLRRLLNPQIATLSAASFRFALVLGDTQQELFAGLDSNHMIPEPREVIDRTVAVVAALAHGNLDDVKGLLNSGDYRRVIAQLLRQAMPKRRFAESYVSAIGPHIDNRPVVRLTKENSKIFEAALRSEIEGPDKTELIRIRGRLRGLELDQEWIRIVDDNNKEHRFSSEGIAIEDVVGPLVNHDVIVSARETERAWERTSRRLVDIEPADATSPVSGDVSD